MASLAAVKRLGCAESLLQVLGIAISLTFLPPCNCSQHTSRANFAYYLGCGFSNRECRVATVERLSRAARGLELLGEMSSPTLLPGLRYSRRAAGADQACHPV